MKTALEWARLGKFVFDLFVVIFSLNLVGKLFMYIPQVPKDWATIIAWAAAGVLLALIWWQEKRKTAMQGSATQGASTALLNSSTFNATDTSGDGRRSILISSSGFPSAATPSIQYAHSAEDTSYYVGKTRCHESFCRSVHRSSQLGRVCEKPPS